MWSFSTVHSNHFNIIHHLRRYKLFIFKGRLANQECLNVDNLLALYREAAFTYPVAQVETQLAYPWELTNCIRVYDLVLNRVWMCRIWKKTFTIEIQLKFIFSFIKTIRIIKSCSYVYVILSKTTNLLTVFHFDGNRVYVAQVLQRDGFTLHGRSGGGVQVVAAQSTVVWTSRENWRFLREETNWLGTTNTRSLLQWLYD